MTSSPSEPPASLTWAGGPNPQFDWEAVKGGGLAYRSSKTAVNALTLMTAQALGEPFKAFWQPTSEATDAAMAVLQELAPRIDGFASQLRHHEVPD